MGLGVGKLCVCVSGWCRQAAASSVCGLRAGCEWRDGECL